MKVKTIQSIEPNIADLANGWLCFTQDKLNDVVLYADRRLAATKKVVE